MLKKLLLAAVTMAWAGVAGAQTPDVPQTGPAADQLRAILKTIRLPPGFKIDLYAVAPGARMLAVGRSGTVFVSTRGKRVWAVTDRAGRHTADAVRAFAPSIAFHDPNGVCMSPDGVLYVAENARVLAFPAAESAAASPVARTVSDPLIPKDGESSNHGAHVCRVNPIDNKLYVALGQPYNVPPHGRMAEFDRWGMAGIVRMDRDGGHREVFARGIRNSVGMDFNPRTHQLWFTDNQVDGMGDDIPPGELNRAPKAGMNFGFPWYGGGHTRTVEYKNDTPPNDLAFPAVETVAHAADLGMTFYTGTVFPEKYRGAIFSAQHGSWNRTTPVGARVMVTLFKPDGSLDHMEPFAEGWLNDDTGEYSGRPVDVAMLGDGSLLVSDDQDGAVYRISYGGG